MADQPAAKTVALMAYFQDKETDGYMVDKMVERKAASSVGRTALQHQVVQLVDLMVVVMEGLSVGLTEFFEGAGLVSRMVVQMAERMDQQTVVMMVVREVEQKVDAMEVNVVEMMAERMVAS